MSTPEELSQLLPLACAWAQQQEQHILQAGVALTPAEMLDASQVGVVHPERVRLLRVAHVPMPQDPVLRAAAADAGLMSAGTTGMALRYGIFIQSDCWRDRKPVIHELAHTAQYERLGGFSSFLQQYLTECLTVGYFHSPLELEAIAITNRLTA